MSDPSRRAFLRSAAAALAAPVVARVMPFTAAVPSWVSVPESESLSGIWMGGGLNGAPTGGTFRLLLGGMTTEPLRWNATVKTVRSAIHGLIAESSNLL